MLIDICEPKEGLNILDFMGLRPILDGFNLLDGHSESGGLEAVSEVFRSIHMEFAFLRVGIEAVFAESPEYLSDMLLVQSHVFRVCEDVV